MKTQNSSAVASWAGLDSNAISLTGQINRHTVPQLWREIKVWKPHFAEVVVDLRAVKSSDSAAMALILHLIEHAKKNHCHIILHSVPKKLLTLFEVSNAKSLLNGHI
jgi:phospholipid transport system transporter-binding protein